MPATSINVLGCPKFPHWDREPTPPIAVFHSDSKELAIVEPLVGSLQGGPSKIRQPAARKVVIPTLVAARDPAKTMRSFSLCAGLCEFLPKGVEVPVITGIHRFHKRAAVQDRIHHAGKA
jgi:hypothetical protein